MTDADYIARIKGRCVINEKGCWLWQGAKVHQGYGIMSYRNKAWRTHRLSYYLHNNRHDPGSLLVCHRCDTRECCNPEHLWLGTWQDNMRDAAAKAVWPAMQSDTCKHGHPLYGDNVLLMYGRHRKCRMCHRVKARRRAGWPEHMLEAPPTPRRGLRPVGGKWPRNTAPIEGNTP